MTMMLEQRQQLLDKIANSSVEYITMGFPDIDGVFRGKFVPIDYFRESVAHKGSFICNILFGWDIQDEILTTGGFSGWDTGFSDIVLMPDISTFREVPWNNRSASVICDVQMPDGSTLEIAPRSVLKRQIDRAANLGYAFNIGYELEFYIFRETAATLREKNFHDLKPLGEALATYSLHRIPEVDDILSEIRRDMIKYGIPIEAVNTEYGTGQFEISIKYASPLEAADMTLLYKAGVKEIVAKYGFTASFMAKVNANMSGSSGHIHQSISPVHNLSQNLFWDHKASGVSDLMRNVISGQLETMSDFTAFYCPTINSYKRLVGGSWAPMTATWGNDNRTTALRAIANSEKSIRLENRLPGADANPYLSIAACMASAIYGIENKPEIPEALLGNVYQTANAVKLPNTLDKAVEALSMSSVARQAFGDAFIDHYLMMRRWELEKYRTAVTEWERNRYLEKI